MLVLQGLHWLWCVLLFVSASFFFTVDGPISSVRLLLCAIEAKIETKAKTAKIKKQKKKLKKQASAGTTRQILMPVLFCRPVNRHKNPSLTLINC